MKDRLNYIDIARGLLILSMLLFHLPYIIKRGVGYDSWALLNISDLTYLYVPFFMPAFFYISGYVTNFQKNCFLFVKSKVFKTLIPATLLTMVSHLIMFDFSIPFLKSHFWIYGAGEWFIPCLVVGEICFLGVSRIKSSHLRIITSLFICVVGVVLSNYTTLTNVWYFENALVFLPFLLLGDLCKKKIFSISFFVCMLGMYLFVLLLYYIIFNKMPFVMQSIQCELHEIPLMLLGGGAGTMALLGVSMFIRRCEWLEYIGRNTLLFYILHWNLAIRVCGLIFNKIVPHSIMIDIISYVICFLMVTVLLMIFAYLFNTKYLKWVLGR